MNAKHEQLQIDHVFEVSLLDEFFAAQVAAGMGCDVVSALFDVPDLGRVGTRLNTIFAQLPSYENPDFLGMDASMNRLKGTVSPHFTCLR